MTLPTAPDAALCAFLLAVCAGFLCCANGRGGRR